MKRDLTLAALVAVFLFVPAIPSQAQMGSGPEGMMGQPYGPNQGYTQTNPGGFYCPNCGTYLPPGVRGYGQGMGPGMMGYGMMNPGMAGYGMMAPGMMGPGMMGYPMMNPGMMGYPMMNPGMTGYYQRLPEPLEEKDV